MIGTDSARVHCNVSQAVGQVVDDSWLLDRVLEVSSNGVIFIDSEGYVRKANQAVSDILELELDSILNQKYVCIKGFTKILSNSLLHKKETRNKKVALKGLPDGGMKYLSLDIVPLFDDGCTEEFLGLLVQIKDVTYFYVMKEQIISLDRLATVGRLAAGLAHEIRNPLTTIIGFVQIVKSLSDPSKFYAYYDVIYSELNRIKNLVTDFVAVSKPRVSSKVPVKLKEFLDEIVLIMSSQALLRGVRLVSNYSLTGSEVIFVDVNQMKQVFMNLIQNAFDAIESEDGEVVLDCNVDDKRRRVVFRITDTGCGMTKEELTRLTTPFFTTKDNGTGLGLTVSKGIIEAHGGKLRFRLKKGRGTRVDIILPF